MPTSRRSWQLPALSPGPSREPLLRPLLEPSPVQSLRPSLGPSAELAPPPLPVPLPGPSQLRDPHFSMLAALGTAGRFVAGIRQEPVS